MLPDRVKGEAAKLSIAWQPERPHCLARYAALVPGTRNVGAGLVRWHEVQAL